MTLPTLDDVLRTRFRELREQSGLTQEALARVATSFGLKWTRVHIAAIERGERRLSFAEVLLVARRLFKVTWEEMLSTEADSVLLAPDAAIRARDLPALCRLETRTARIYRTRLPKQSTVAAPKRRKRSTPRRAVKR
jgi:transcriptional regulator with XRE-family HTH domain